MTRAQRHRRGLVVLVRVLILLGIGGGLALALEGWARWLVWRDQAVALVDSHVAWQVAHPGWSFPSRLWSADAPLDLPAPRLLAEARARGYAEACPPRAPGEICPDTGEVVLRGGRFPEGEQPPGNRGWTRPLALEPLLVGVLVGPDAEIREHLPLDQAPPALLAALVTAEDADFWRHPGVNVRGILRAAAANARGLAVEQGASTLTMQLVRGLSQDRERTAARKLREALAALAVDRHLGKRGVLQAYLDAPYLGQDGSRSICGFQAAARYYWGKDARDLDLSEAATLASILPAPGRWAPDAHPEEARQRRDQLLMRLVAAGWDPGEVVEALARPVRAAPHAQPEPRWPAYLQATRAWLEAKLGPETVYGAGLDVFTALDPVVQDAGDRLLAERVDFLDQVTGRRGPGPLEAAAVLLDMETGLVVAVHDANLASATDFNRATQARRQSGSAIKPVVYGLALAHLGPDGHPLLSAATTMPNERRTFPGTNGWRPVNVGDDYSPVSTLAMGLAWSQNIVAASLLEAEGGPREMIAFARRLGFDTSRWPEEMGLALGQAEVNPLEMARMAATYARGGLRPAARTVEVALDPGGRVRVSPPPADERVVPEESAAIMRDLMRLVVSYGTGWTTRGAGGFPGWNGPAMGKTGTSDEEKDLWFTGATPRYAGAVWVGYETPSRVGGTAGDLAGALWGWWMRAVHEGLEPGEFAGPVLQRRGICTWSGQVPNSTCRVIGAPFLPGTGPKGVCPYDHPPEPEDEEPHENLWKRRARLAEEAAARQE